MRTRSEALAAHLPLPMSQITSPEWGLIMAGFDTNALANPRYTPPANPLEMAGQALTLKNALLGNKIQQAEYDSRMASGNALTGATDANGNTDYNKARADYVRSGHSFGAEEAFSRQNVARHEDVLNQDEQLAFQNHASNAAADGMGRLVDDPTNANVRGYAAFMKRLTPAASGQIDAITNQVLALPTAGQRKEALKAAFTAHMGQEASNRVFGTPTSVDDGQTIQTGTQASGMNGGAFTPASGVQRQLSPEANAQLQPVMEDTPYGRVQRYRTAGSIRAGEAPQGFTGRRVDVTGNGGGADAGNPIGYEDQAKHGVAVQSALRDQQGEVSQTIATLRNLDGLIARIPKDARSRKLAEISNNLDKFGISPDPAYATLSQEITKAGSTVRKQMMDTGAGPHTNAGLSELDHITPSMDMTPTAARALVNEQISKAEFQRARGQMVQGITNPTEVMQRLADYDANFDPRFATIRRLGPEEGREYARTHIGDPAQYAASLYRMARAARDKGYDYGMTQQQRDRIIAAYEAQRGGR